MNGSHFKSLSEGHQTRQFSEHQFPRAVTEMQL